MFQWNKTMFVKQQKNLRQKRRELIIDPELSAAFDSGNLT
jgi:hypothetical protein